MRSQRDAMIVGCVQLEQWRQPLETTLSVTGARFVWPASAVLIERAERSLGIERSSSQFGAVGVTAMPGIPEMEARLVEVDRCLPAIVPTGFESAGPLAFLKRSTKKITRRLMWWYVEPRWIVQREINVELAAVTRLSVQALGELSLTTQALQARIEELERAARGAPT